MAPGVAELFGATHLGAFLIREPGKGAKWTNWQYGLRDARDYHELRGVGAFAHNSVFPAFYLQTLKLTTAQPLLVYGDEVAGCVNNFGRGKAYLTGTFLGHAGPAYNDWPNGDFLAAVLAAAGVVSDRAGMLARRRRVLGNRGAWFFFNSSDHSIEESVPLEEFRKARDLLGEELPTASGAIRVKVTAMDVCCVLLER